MGRRGWEVVSRSEPFPPWGPVKEVSSFLPFHAGRSAFLQAQGQSTWIEPWEAIGEGP